MNMKTARLTDGPITQILLRLTFPTILGGIGMVIFNITDTYFVGRLGTIQLAALSFTFPVVLFATSIAHGVGIGVSAIVSRAIGEGNHLKASRITTDSLSLSLLLVGIISVTGLATIDDLFRLLGATPETMPYIRQYMTVWYRGAVFMVVPMVANNAIRASGDTKTPGLIVLCAALINIIMDPLLIFGIGPFPEMGVTGAAISTVLSRAIMMLLSFIIIQFKEKMIIYEKPDIHSILDSWRQILYIGAPSALTKIALPFAAGIMTSIVSLYGSAAVAGFGVATRIEVFVLMVILSLSAVMGPFVGQNYGAGKFDRIKSGIRISNQISLIWGLTAVIALIIFASRICSVFSSDPEVISAVKRYLLIVPAGYGVYGIVLIASSAMTVLQKPINAAAVTIVQTFLLSIPFAYIGSYLAGLQGIFLAMPLSYLISSLIARPMLNKIINEREELLKLKRD